MSAKKAARPTDYLGDLEQKVGDVDIAEKRVADAQTVRNDTETVLDTSRAKVWRLLGTPFGNVRLGNFRFSRLMLIITAAFFGMLIGALLIGPVMGILLAIAAIGVGISWVRSKIG